MLLLLVKNSLQLEDDGEISPITIGGPSNVLPGDEDLSSRVDNEKLRKYPTLAGVVDHPAIYLIDGN